MGNRSLFSFPSRSASKIEDNSTAHRLDSHPWNFLLSNASDLLSTIRRVGRRIEGFKLKLCRATGHGMREDLKFSKEDWRLSFRWQLPIALRTLVKGVGIEAKLMKDTYYIELNHTYKRSHFGYGFWSSPLFHGFDILSTLRRHFPGWSSLKRCWSAISTSFKCLSRVSLPGDHQDTPKMQTSIFGPNTLSIGVQKVATVFVNPMESTNPWREP